MTKSSPTTKRVVTNRLWRYRKIRELSQKDIARLLGHKNTAHVSRWENGTKTPTLENALLLAHILKAPVEALFSERAAELQAAID
ncbi:MAG: helix-turn-helix transcriptional regulator, partial [Burkholderiales bacterium]